MKCWVCGKDDGVKANDDRRFYCNEHEPAAKEEADKIKTIFYRYKFLHMYETALANLEKRAWELYEYRAACKTVKATGLKNPTAFDSSDEVLAAIVLTRYGYKVKTQAKIGRFKTDLMCEAQKVIIEIDGDAHKYKMDADDERDEYIKRKLGAGWRIFRVQTTELRKHPENIALALNTYFKKKVS